MTDYRTLYDRDYIYHFDLAGKEHTLEICKVIGGVLTGEGESVTTRNGNMVIIEPTEPEHCEMCGKKAELRPYGPKGESICFACGMQDKEGTSKRMQEMLFGELDS